MIPEPNIDHIVLRAGFAPINDLVRALQDANILPRRVPVDGGMAEHRLRIERLDLELVLRYRLFFDDMRIDAYVESLAPGGNEMRIGVPLRQGAIDVSVLEISTGNEISRFSCAFSGRALVYGSIESDSEAGAPYFVIERLPEFKLDDFSERIPPLLPGRSFEALIARVINRDVRARPTAATEAGMIRFPISFMVDDLLSVNPVTYGLALRDPAAASDPMSREVCLPAGYGSPQCGAGPIGTANFYGSLDSFLRVATAADPVSLIPIGRSMQLDVGWRVIDREVSKDNGWEDWKDVTVFRFRTGKWVNWRPAADGKGSVYGEFKAELQVAYPKIVWCRGWTKLPWGGRVSYDYPCGITRGWHGLKDVRVWAQARLEMIGSRACVQVLDKGSSGSTDLGGLLLTVAYLIASIAIISMLPLIGDIVAGALAAAGLLVVSLLVSIEAIVGLILRFLPNEYCADVSDFLKLPLFDGKIEASLNNALIDFDRNGLTVAINPDFEPKPELRALAAPAPDAPPTLGFSR